MANSFELDEGFVEIPTNNIQQTSQAPAMELDEGFVEIPTDKKSGILGQFQAGQAETDIALQDFRKLLLGDKSLLIPDAEKIVTETEAPEGFLEKTSRFVGGLTTPIVPGLPAGGGAVAATFNPLKAIAGASVRKGMKIGAKTFPDIAYFLSKAKNILDPTQFRGTFNAMMRIGGISDEATDILYKDPNIAKMLRDQYGKTPDVTGKLRKDITNEAVKVLNLSNKKQNKAVDLVSDNLVSFIKKTKAKGVSKINDLLIEAGVSPERAVKIIKKPSILTTKETAPELSKKVLKELTSRKKQAGRMLNKVNNEVFSNKSSINIADNVDNFISEFNNAVSSGKFNRSGSKGFASGSNLIKKLNDVKPTALKIGMDKDGVLSLSPKTGEFPKLVAKDLHIIKKIIQDEIIEKEIKGDVANILSKFADNINGVLRVKFPKYAKANDLYSSTIGSIDSIIGKGKSGLLYDPKTYQQFRNKLASAGKAGFDKIDEDVVSVLKEINPKVADSVEDYLISKIEKNNINKYIKSSLTEINNTSRLGDVSKSIGKVTNVSQKDLIKTIDDYLPSKYKYWKQAERALAANELIPVVGKTEPGVIHAISRGIMSLIEPQKKIVQATGLSRGVTEKGIPKAIIPIKEGFRTGLLRPEAVLAKGREKRNR